LAIALAGESTTLTLWLEKKQNCLRKDIVCARTWHVTWQKEENSLKDLHPLLHSMQTTLNQKFATEIQSSTSGILWLSNCSWMQPNDRSCLEKRHHGPAEL
jgi:hypothetical protein